MPNRKASRLTLALLGLALISSLALAQSAFSINPFLSANYGQITDADGNTISAMSDPSTPIHASRGSKPAFLAPDGHPLTLGEFDRVQGVAIANCSGAGTQRPGPRKQPSCSATRNQLALRRSARLRRRHPDYGCRRFSRSPVKAALRVVAPLRSLT